MKQGPILDMESYAEICQGMVCPNNGRRYLFMAITLIGVVILCETTSWVFLTKFFPNHEIVRQVLLGNNRDQVEHLQHSIGQAYLLYIPKPGFSRRGIIQHNAQGYRGPAIPFRRSPGKLRVLFLGGSTTYGWTVDQPNEAYPAVVGRILEQQFQNRLHGVEVMNAGLPWGTSAEILTHYLFKYRYYRPDIVVVNTGGNDAQGSAMENYQPDYSHWRKPLPVPLPLSPSVRWIMYSRTIALVAVRLFYGHLTKGEYFVDEGGVRPPADWYEKATIGAVGSGQIPEEGLAFKHNLRTIIREVSSDGTQLLLVPFRLNPDPHSDGYGDESPNEILRNERILKQLALENDVEFAPFPAHVISPEAWVDYCHLNAEGSREKAAHVVEYLLPIISQLLADREDKQLLES